MSEEANLLHLLAALALGYLLGSIPFGLIFTRMAGLGDIRKVGSGNIGATNVLRTGHKGIAAATLVGDALKGTAAVLLAAFWWGPQLGTVAATYALEHLGGQSHSYTRAEFNERYAEHFGAAPVAGA